MGVLATILGSLVTPLDPDPASSTSAAISASQKNTKEALEAKMIPTIGYSF